MSKSTPAVAKSEEYQRATPKELLSVSLWVIKFVFKVNPKYTIAIVATDIISKFIDLANTLILAKLLDAITKSVQLQSTNLQQLNTFILILLAYTVVQMINNNISYWASTGLRTEGQPSIRRKFYTKLNTLGIQTLEQPSVNDIVFRANNYLSNLTGYLVDASTIISNFIKIVTMLVVISGFLPAFIPIIILSTIPGALIDRRGRSKLYKFLRENTEDQRKASMSESDLTSAIKLQEITLTQGFNFLDNKFWNFQKYYSDSWIKIASNWRKQSSLSGLMSDSVVLVCTYKVFLDAFKHVISAGDTLYRYRFLNQFQGSIQNLFRNFNDLAEHAIRIADIKYVFELEPAFHAGSIPLKKLDAGPKIDFKKVSFKYPNSETLVLKDLSINIKSGEKVAIVGKNGAGKTTLVKLICKLYQPTTGEIIFNDQLLKDVNIRDLHKNIGILFQDYNVYPQLTVKENIVMGDSDLPIDEIGIRLAAEQADASEFINKYKNKYDQVLNEKVKGGVRPSTGQWQKLAIARFFYRNAPLVIFDEPTAAIDAVSEYNIFNRIYEFFKGKTVIIISHRFSTVRNADRILVLDAGRIVEDGNHEQLMALNGQYAQAFLLQAKGYVESIAV